MREARFSIPVIGGVTLCLTSEEIKQHKENTMKKLNEIKDLTKDKSFRKALLRSAAITAGVAVAIVGINMVWKWYFASKVLGSAGYGVKTAGWLKVLGATTVVGTAGYLSYKDTVIALKQSKGLAAAA